VGLVEVGAAADGLLVGAGRDVLLGAAFPEVLGDDRPVVQVVAPFLVQGLGEGEPHGLAVDRLGLLQPAPQVVVGNRLELADLEGEDDVRGREGPAVAPGEAASLRRTRVMRTV